MGMIILEMTATRRRPVKKKANPVHAYKRLHKKIVDSMIEPPLIEEKREESPPPLLLLANATIEEFASETPTNPST